MLYASYVDIQKYSAIAVDGGNIGVLQLSYRKGISGYGCYYQEANT